MIDDIGAATAYLATMAETFLHRACFISIRKNSFLWRAS
jgi:hypothetical protein